MYSSIFHKHYKVVLTCLFLFSIFTSAHIVAEPLKQMHKGIQLNAKTNFDAAELKERRVFVIVHGTLAHNGMEIIDSLLSILEEEGEAALALTLSLNVSDRTGMFSCDLKHTHHHEDASEEIKLWLDWLSTQGVKNVVLVGHSRGSAQVADYIAKTQDKRVQQAVLIAPPTASKGADKKITALPGTTDIKVDQFLHCGKSTVTASSYASYYGDHQANSTLKTLRALSLPIALILGSEDKVVKPKIWESLAPLPNNVQLTIIPGADHFFRDLYSYEIVENVLEWAE